MNKTLDPKKDPTLWHCRDGRVLKIVEMDTGHLRNTINFLRRQGWTTRAEAMPPPHFPTFQGEYAQMFAEQDWQADIDRYMTQRISARLALMEQELKKRTNNV